MKSFNLTKVALSLVIVTTLVGTNAFAAAKFKEKLLTKNKSALADRTYQIKSQTISELSDEEAMEFINDPMTLTQKDLTLPVVPPRFPVNRNDGLVANVATATPTATTAGGIIDNVIMVVDKLIAIGQKIIPTIEKGKAVVTNNSMAAISVLPSLDSKDPVVHDMGGWSLPVTKHYKISYKNGFNSEVVSFIYSVSYQYGGSHDGKGKYLAGIRASARNITVNWGFDVDASSQLIQISNVGTSNNVVAGATIEMSYTVKNWTRQITSNVSFFVAADGRLLKLD
jgi:hypothetical protein